jgi:hypothetical protein
VTLPVPLSSFLSLEAHKSLKYFVFKKTINSTQKVHQNFQSIVKWYGNVRQVAYILSGSRALCGAIEFSGLFTDDIISIQYHNHNGAYRHIDRQREGEKREGEKVRRCDSRN